MNKLKAGRVCTSYFVSTVLREEITAGSGRKSRVTAAPLNGFSRLLSVFTFIHSCRDSRSYVPQRTQNQYRERETDGKREREGEKDFSSGSTLSQLMSLMSRIVFLVMQNGLLETQRRMFICPDLDVCSEYVKRERLRRK